MTFQKRNTKTIGNIGEAVVISELVKRNIPVFIPFGDNETFDILAYFDGKYQKIQVKTCSKLYNKNINLKLTIRRYGHDYRYSTNDVDYFAVYSVELDCVSIVKNEEKLGSSSLKIKPNTYTIDNLLESLSGREQFLDKEPE